MIIQLGPETLRVRLNVCEKKKSVEVVPRKVFWGWILSNACRTLRRQSEWQVGSASLKCLGLPSPL